MHDRRYYSVFLAWQFQGVQAYPLKMRIVKNSYNKSYDVSYSLFAINARAELNVFNFRGYRPSSLDFVTLCYPETYWRLDRA